MNYPIAVARWNDAWFHYEEGEPWKKVCPVETVGYLVREDPAVVSIAQEILDDGSFRAVTHIPRAIVTDLTILLGAGP